MTPRERVRAALAHSEPDFVPCDYYATPEIHGALLEYFGLTNAPGASRLAFAPMGGPGDNLLPERLGTDIRYIEPPYIGPAAAVIRRRLDDGHVGHPPPADAERVRRIRGAGGMALRRLDDRRGSGAVPLARPRLV